jgi:hypothetical protein
MVCVLNGLQNKIIVYSKLYETYYYYYYYYHHHHHHPTVESYGRSTASSKASSPQ